jgi:hypothetical protein
MMDAPNAPWGTVETLFDPIHSAARMRGVPTVQQELDAGVNVDVLNGVQQTAMAAIRRYGSPLKVRIPAGLKLLACSSLPARISTANVSMVAPPCTWRRRGGASSLFNC